MFYIICFILLLVIALMIWFFAKITNKMKKINKELEELHKNATIYDNYWKDNLRGEYEVS